MREDLAAIAAVLSIAALGCDGTKSPSSPSRSGAAVTAVRIVFAGSTTRRADLPASAAACAGGVGATHIHPSWRSFEAIALQPVPPDRYEIGFTDVSSVRACRSGSTIRIRATKTPRVRSPATSS